MSGAIPGELNGYISLFNLFNTNGSNGSFVNLVVTGSASFTYLTPKCPVFTDSADKIITQGPMTNGQLIIGNSGNLPTLNTLTLSANLTQVLGPGTISLDTVQGIQTTSSPTFTNLTLTGLTAKCPIFTNATDQLITQGPMTNGQLIIGNTGNLPSLNTLTAAGGIIITNGPGTITIDGSGFVESVSAGLNITITGTATNPIVNTVHNPVFTHETLSDTSNQILFGTSGTHTLQVSWPTAGMTANNTFNEFAGFTSGSTWFSDNLPANIANETDGACTGFGRAVGGSMTGSNNTLFGYFSGSSMTTDTNCACFGDNTYVNAIGGRDNTCIGHAVMAFNTGGQFNTAVGSLAMGGVFGTTASQNVAVGYQSLFNTSTDTALTAVGYQAGKSLKGASQGTFVGFQSAPAATTGTNNVIIGDTTCTALTTGAANSVCGSQALTSITTQSYNTVMGAFAATNVTSQYNTIIGEQAVGNSSLTQDRITAVGWSAGFNANPTTIACYLGSQAGQNDVGPRNTYIGASCGLGIPAATNSDMTGLGYLALTNINVAANLTAVGSLSLTAATTASDCTGLGYKALTLATTPSNCTAVGSLALSSLISSSNSTAVGFSAGQHCVAVQNTYIGTQAGQGDAGNANTGTLNSGGGFNSINGINSGSRNSAWGAQSLLTLTTGSDNCALGRLAGGTGTPITTGSQNICIGSGSQVNNANAQNRIVLGFNATCNNDNTMILGNSSITDISPGALCTLGANQEFSTIFADTLDIDSLELTNTTNQIQFGNPAGNHATQNVPTANLGSSTTFSILNSGTNIALVDGTIPTVVQNETVTHEVMIGISALSSVTTATDMVCVGYQCAQNTTTGGSSVVIGSQAWQNNTVGTNSVVIGYQAAQGGAASHNGGANVILGYQAANAMTLMSNSVIIGFSAVNTGSPSNFNTVIGSSAGQTLGTSGQECVLLGASANVSSAAASNRIAIGYQASSTADNVCILGNSSLSDVSPGANTCTLGATNNWASITLVSTGGTPTPLNYYEEATVNTTATGIWAASQNVTMTFVRTGIRVIMHLSRVSANANTASNITTTATVPARFRPANNVTTSFTVIDNGFTKVATIQILSTGVINIWSVNTTGIQFTNFAGTSGSGQSGFNYQAVSWLYNV